MTPMRGMRYHMAMPKRIDKDGTHQVTIRLAPDVLERADALATKRRVIRSDIMREALRIGLPLLRQELKRD